MLVDETILNHPLTDGLIKKRLANFIEQGFPISIGRYSYGCPKLYWSKGDFGFQLTIGSFCSIADDVSIFVGKHGRHTTDYVSTYPIGLIYGRSSQKIESATQIGDFSVRIENDVWIGRGAMIFAGVTIGNGAVIGARAVVTKDVEPYSIVVGTPAREVRKRFQPEVIEKLIKLKWWNWSDEMIKERLPFFTTPLFYNHLDTWLEVEGSQNEV
jgi:chloramphenicol O-acetyltransferase type B